MTPTDIGTSKELLARMHDLGVRLWVDEGRLRYRSPPGRLTAEDLDQLAQHKPDLLHLLSNDRPKREQAVDRALPLEGAMFGRTARDWSRRSADPYIRHVAPFRGFVFDRLGIDKTFVRGSGCYLYDTDGKCYLDFVAQYGAVPFGHDPTQMWAALTDVRDRAEPNLTAMSVQNAAGELAAALLANAPPGLAHVSFANSGAEAVEVALKLARASTGRQGILSTRNGFHGLTLGSLSATGRSFFQEQFGAPVAGFDLVPFGDLAALEEALALGSSFYAAFLVEPVQGEGGVHVAPPGYLSGAQELCRRYGVLLIVDEVQTGLGRTGAMFACENEEITPDLLLVAKALGGGLMPIGACLSTAQAYPDNFDLRHSSTFAGNTLACRVGLAAVAALNAEDRRLVREVHRHGERLTDQLLALRDRYPDVVADVRGRGLLLGVELDLDGLARRQSGLVACLHDLGLLLQVSMSYLLNVEGVRVSAAVTGSYVLRLEPPLVVDEAQCDRAVRAVEHLCAVLSAGDAGRLLAHLVRGDSAEAVEALVPAPRRAIAQTSKAAHFAFVVHLLDKTDLRRTDPSLGNFRDDELEDLVERIAEFRTPVPVGELSVRPEHGRAAVGELILLPFTPEELLDLSGREAVGLVQDAVDLAAQRGAEVVGLGGFTSIVADGGLALGSSPRVAVTSGNSLTAWAACAAMEAHFAQRDLPLHKATIAVIGANGAIGRMMSLLCAERAGEIILVGNPHAAAASVERLRTVVHDCCDHITKRAHSGIAFEPDSLAARVLAGTDPAALFSTTTDLEHHLRRADVVITATSATTPFLTAADLGVDTLMIDVSRPYNIDPESFGSRPDLTLIRGGLLAVPGNSILGPLADETTPGALVACACETVVLALSGMRSPHLCGRLDPHTVDTVGGLARDLGFTVDVT